MDEIQANYEQDMAMYGTGLAKDDLTYRNLPKHLLTDDSGTERTTGGLRMSR